MRLLRAALSIVFVGAMFLWLYAAIHGFHGTYCLHSGGTLTCRTQVAFRGREILWAAPIVAIACALLLRAMRYRGALRRVRRPGGA